MSWLTNLYLFVSIIIIKMFINFIIQYLKIKKAQNDTYYHYGENIYEPPMVGG